MKPKVRDDQRLTVPGRTAYRLTRVATVMGLISVSSGFGLAVIGSLINPPRGTFSSNLLIGIAVCVVVPFFAVFWRAGTKAEQRQKAEVAAGYTTLRGRYRDSNQLNPIDGELLRVAGRDFLSRAEFRRAVQAAKARSDIEKH